MLEPIEIDNEPAIECILCGKYLNEKIKDSVCMIKCQLDWTFKQLLIGVEVYY